LARYLFPEQRKRFPAKSEVSFLKLDVFREIVDSHRLGAKNQSGHHDVSRKCELLLFFIVVNDIEDVRGGEVVDGTAFLQVDVDIVCKNSSEVMRRVFGQFLFHVVSPLSSKRKPGIPVPRP
jgi:hypothetical protein